MIHPYLPCLVCQISDPYKDSLMCGGCYNRLRAHIATLVGAHAWLGLAMLNPISTWKPGTIGRTATGSRPPFRTDLHDARVDIEAKLTSWARAVAEEHQPALAGPADGELATVGRWLIARLPWISDQLWCDAIAGELAEAVTAAYALVPWDRLRRDLPMPCPGCQQVSLSQYGGDDQVTCRIRTCGRAMPWADYWRLVVEASERERREKEAVLEGIQAKIKPPTSSEGVAA